MSTKAAKRPPRERLVRPAVLRRAEGERHASWLELFFDLCFVAAVAALAADLHESHSAGALLRFAGLFVPVWWAWMGYTWYATAFDNDDVVFRLGYLTAMLLVVILSTGVGSVGEGDSTRFALCYGLMFLLLAALYARAWRHASEQRRFCVGYGLGDAIGGALWLISLAVPTPGRYWIWALAMVVLMAAPVIAVRSYAGTGFDGGHIAERYGLFTLIVLGESVVAAAAAVTGSALGLQAGITAAAGFALAACLWWLYFDFVRSSALTRDHLLTAFIWGYGHLLVFAGIAATAVGVESAIEASVEGHGLAGLARAELAGGLVAYLAATAAIQAVNLGRIDLSVIARLTAALAVAIIGAAAAGLSALAFVALVLAVTAVLVVVEVLRAARRPAAPPAAEPPLVAADA